MSNNKSTPTTKLVISSTFKEVPFASSGWDSDTAFLPGNELLVTGSIGLYHYCGKFYMQVITAHNENNYIIEIPAALAVVINEREGLEITNATAPYQVDTSF